MKYWNGNTPDNIQADPNVICYRFSLENNGVSNLYVMWKNQAEADEVTPSAFANVDQQSNQNSSGNVPPNQGFPPPNQGFQPPSQGIQPPTQGIQPPNLGFPPPIPPGADGSGFLPPGPMGFPPFGPPPGFVMFPPMGGIPGPAGMIINSVFFVVQNLFPWIFPPNPFGRMIFQQIVFPNPFMMFGLRGMPSPFFLAPPPEIVGVEMSPTTSITTVNTASAAMQYIQPTSVASNPTPNSVLGQ
ncbi:MAG: hypothetical protein HQM08_25605 [Candidatus Riflebacteria bacterium]|nr:hypothetical protein [Candidatus Riflebacteria bacterium]